MLKEYNVGRHYDTLHADKYNNLQGPQRRGKVNEMLADLKKEQSLFTRSQEISEAAVKASYIIANEIAVASKPFIEGEFYEKMLAEGCRDCVP